MGGAFARSGLSTALAVAVALLATGCASPTGVTPAPDPAFPRPSTSSAPVETRPTSTSVATTTTAARRDCSPTRLDGRLIVDRNRVRAAIAVAEATFECAEEVTLTGIGDPAAASAAAHAIAVGGPLLLVGVRGLSDEPLLRAIADLDPERVSVIGLEDADLAALSGFDVDRPVASGDPLEAGADVAVDQARRLWIVGDDAGDVEYSVRAAAAAAGDGVVVVPGDDLRALDDREAAVIRTASMLPSILVARSADAEWQLDVVRSGHELPGGGLLMFPGRRLVALYGHPGVPVLGVLGEQGPEAGIERLAPLLGAYDDDGVATVATFEIIATVADAAAGADGDYSAEITVDALRPWVETAAEQGAYVILDLQPGRTDFLTQAQRYEELLRLPHVGLALDPEWRLKPDQFHLRQIGSVAAAEVNTVAEWLAGIVREEALPQKLLVLHQFRYDMIADRETVEQPPELAVLVHVDGQGALQLKYDTWGVLTTLEGSEELWWGWKNFYDEDPQLATPAQVLDLSPTVYMVSFQ